MPMRLRVLLPSRILIDREILKLVAEAPNGSFGILPRHVDFVAALVPGVLTYFDTESREHFAGIDEGILVKRGAEVTVSTMGAIEGRDLEALRETMQQRWREMDDHERSARTALARLEAGIVRNFLNLAERQ